VILIGKEDELVRPPLDLALEDYYTPKAGN